MIRIDAKGDVCPIPIIKTKKELKNIEKNGTVLVIVDNETAKENLEKMAKELGYKYSSKTVNKEHYEVEIIKGEVSEAEDKLSQNQIDTLENNEAIKQYKKDNTLVVISSITMGDGDEELGKILIKGFIYALTEVEKLPVSIIFYNGGAKLSVKDSPVIEDLQKLEQLGVEILTCGTCLDYYNIKDNLAVGKITNMYSIVEKMNVADKIIKP
ncbi:response regulator SirA [Clostridium pasteurianum]|nr:sulfurtransferase-like selenium metabolism protein YedF [Clostridium pasteurianum]AOZ73847.1 response regulator SirA [Clostridium pasteurianum DSM 525 = ATCC 6013]AOZ77644.1 response regulator SirA [Clostridium pasteurianum]ELP60986.1 SirA family protein [Clostridium pasteurianum DSM 525 = ATCC 6013]OMH21898.1 response regulator SirA [Clostridium pasteurianum]UZW14593.1 sulfurtransferase-like selenium metabolism protein YedF [Clostridium pasteurianum]